METETKEIRKVPSGSLLIMLGAGICFINAIASYAFGLQYANFKFYGFLAMFIQVLQSFSLLYLGVSLYNEKQEKGAAALVVLANAVAILFALLMKFSNHPMLYQMRDWSYGENRYILHVLFLIVFTAATIISLSAKEKTDKKVPLIALGVALITLFFSFYSEDTQGTHFAYNIYYIVEILALLLVAFSNITGKFKIASAKTINKKTFLIIVIVMVVAAAIMIPISYDLNDGHIGPVSSSERVSECASCKKDFKDDSNIKYITKTNMCQNCYFNFCAMTGKEPKIYK